MKLSATVTGIVTAGAMAVPLEQIDLAVFGTIVVFILVQIVCSILVYRMTMRGAKAAAREAVSELETRLAVQHERVVEANASLDAE
jgi:hypothetical protein